MGCTCRIHRYQGNDTRDGTILGGVLAPSEWRDFTENPRYSTGTPERPRLRSKDHGLQQRQNWNRSALTKKTKPDNTRLTVNLNACWNKTEVLEKVTIQNLKEGNNRDFLQQIINNIQHTIKIYWACKAEKHDRWPRKKTKAVNRNWHQDKPDVRIAGMDFKAAMTNTYKNVKENDYSKWKNWRVSARM